MAKFPRPEEIKLTCPTVERDRFYKILSDYLKPSAKLKEIQEDKNTVFKFWPTAGEYFLVSILFRAECQAMGAKELQ